MQLPKQPGKRPSQTQVVIVGRQPSRPDHAAPRPTDCRTLQPSILGKPALLIGRRLGFWEATLGGARRVECSLLQQFQLE